MTLSVIPVGVVTTALGRRSIPVAALILQTQVSVGMRRTTEMGKIEYVDCTPHWPGLLDWLEHTAIDATGVKPDAVAITGGADTDMYVIFADNDVRKFVGGVFIAPRVYATTGEGRSARADEVLDIAYCYKDATGTYVAGKLVSEQ
jgi:hypothetical protein